MNLSASRAAVFSSLLFSYLLFFLIRNGYSYLLSLISFSQLNKRKHNLYIDRCIAYTHIRNLYTRILYTRHAMRLLAHTHTVQFESRRYRALFLFHLLAVVLLFQTTLAYCSPFQLHMKIQSKLITAIWAKWLFQIPSIIELSFSIKQRPDFSS